MLSQPTADATHTGDLKIPQVVVREPYESTAQLKRRASKLFHHRDDRETSILLSLEEAPGRRTAKPLWHNNVATAAGTSEQASQVSPGAAGTASDSGRG
eukprot:286529-Prymnesium_polylepis.1